MRQNDTFNKHLDTSVVLMRVRVRVWGLSMERRELALAILWGFIAFFQNGGLEHFETHQDWWRLSPVYFIYSKQHFDMFHSAR